MTVRNSDMIYHSALCICGKYMVELMLATMRRTIHMGDAQSENTCRSLRREGPFDLPE